MRKAWLVWIVLWSVAASGGIRAQSARPLDIYFIDVEGGQSTLFVSPSGESLLVDAGSPGARDADRIVATARSAGLTQIDYLVVTHYDADHVGGVKDVAERLPIRTFVDHGPRLPGAAFSASPNYQAMVDRVDAAYAEARARGRHLEVKVGDTVPIAGLDVQIVSAQGAALTKPVSGAGAPNPLCGEFKAQDEDKTENARSVGMIIRLGTFRMLDLGDLTWQKEHELVCPNNLLGTVDVYLTTHHGLNLSGPPALVHAVQPRVAVMNNGPRKGGSRETWTTVKSSPGLQDIWQLHYSVPRPANPSFHEAADSGGRELNAADDFIANLEETADHASVYALKLSAKPDGAFRVTNLRNGFSREYGARR
jgi:beta-lactamase superfamily II metal-dependent hydrolase